MSKKIVAEITSCILCPKFVNYQEFYAASHCSITGNNPEHKDFAKDCPLPEWDKEMDKDNGS